MLSAQMQVYMKTLQTGSYLCHGLPLQDGLCRQRPGPVGCRSPLHVCKLPATPCRSDKAVMVSAGMQADMKTLHKMMQARNVQYAHAHRKPMSVGALAQLLGNTLYYKRFFPYYTFNLVAGLDSEGG